MLSSSPKLIVYRLVLHDPDAGHLFQNTLSSECLEPVDLEFWIPDITDLPDTRYNGFTRYQI